MFTKNMFVVKFLSKPIDPAVNGNYSHRCRIVNGVLTSVSEVEGHNRSSFRQSDTFDPKGDAESTPTDRLTTEVCTSQVGTFDAVVVSTEAANLTNLTELHRKSTPISLHYNQSSLTSPRCHVVPDGKPANAELQQLNSEVGITDTSPQNDGCLVAVASNQKPEDESVNTVCDDSIASYRDNAVTKSVTAKAALRLTRDRRLKANRRERERVHSLAVAFNVLGDLLPQSCAR
jgi:hypothetical protein